MSEADEENKGEPQVAVEVRENHETVVLSKRAQKRLKKKQDWIDSKLERRKKEKEKRKLRIAAKKLTKDFSETRTTSRKALKDVKMSDSCCKVSVVFDMQFSDLMTDRDLGKCLKQIMKCYSYNRRLASPVQLFMTSHQGRVEAEMMRNNGYRNWDFNFESQPYDSVFSADKIVYLTAESDNVLDRLEQDTAYIIGGLVDHNHQKGLCHEKAVEKGIRTARLPIDEFISMKTRKVLTVNHVYEILAEVCQGHSWKDSFLKILPERKGGVALSNSLESSTQPDSVKVVEDTANVVDSTSNCDNSPQEC